MQQQYALEVKLPNISKKSQHNLQVIRRPA